MTGSKDSIEFDDIQGAPSPDNIQGTDNVESTVTLSGPVDGNGNAAPTAPKEGDEGEEGIPEPSGKILI